MRLRQSIIKGYLSVWGDIGIFFHCMWLCCLLRTFLVLAFKSFWYHEVRCAEEPKPGTTWFLWCRLQRNLKYLRFSPQIHGNANINWWIWQNPHRNPCCAHSFILLAIIMSFKCRATWVCQIRRSDRAECLTISSQVSWKPSSFFSSSTDRPRSSTPPKGNGSRMVTKLLRARLSPSETLHYFGVRDKSRMQPAGTGRLIDWFTARSEKRRSLSRCRSCRKVPVWPDNWGGGTKYLKSRINNKECVILN